MKPNSFDHPKTERFADELGIRLREAWGMLDRLMALTQQYAERGNLGSVFTDAQIARRLDWAGEGETPIALVEALLVAGFIDLHPVHRFVIHDWPEHAPDYCKRRVRESKESWAVGDIPEDSGINTDYEDGEIPEDSSPGHGPSLPFPTIPSPSLPLCGADAPSPPEPDVKRFVNMLTGGIVPVGRDGETWESPRAWLEAHTPRLIAAAQLKANADSGPQFNRAFRSVMLSWWANKAPPTRTNGSKPHETKAEKTARIIEEQDRAYAADPNGRGF